nr:hypothetical protein [Angustibacter aerolatus]
MTEWPNGGMKFGKADIRSPHDFAQMAARATGGLRGPHGHLGRPRRAPRRDPAVRRPRLRPRVPAQRGSQPARVDRRLRPRGAAEACTARAPAGRRCDPEAMEADRVRALRDVLHHTEWWSRAAAVGRTIRRTPGPGHLLLVGTPAVEPWHLAAHLDDEARLSGLSQAAPQARAVEPAGRRAPAPGDRDAAARAGGPRRDRLRRQPADAARGAARAGRRRPAHRCHRRRPRRRRQRARRAGARADERVVHRPGAARGAGRVGVTARACRPRCSPGRCCPRRSSLAQHFISAASGEPEPQRGPGWRQRLSRVLETISGPPPHSTGQRR